jgi:hypothetical protein
VGGPGTVVRAAQSLPLASGREMLSWEELEQSQRELPLAGPAHEACSAAPGNKIGFALHGLRIRASADRSVPDRAWAPPDNASTSRIEPPQLRGRVVTAKLAMTALQIVASFVFMNASAERPPTSASRGRVPAGGVGTPALGLVRGLTRLPRRAADEVQYR